MRGASAREAARTGSARGRPALERRGVRLAYRESGSGSPPLVFVHGWGGDASHWAAQTRAFSRRHRVIRVHLRGHGRSDAPPGDYTIASFADDLDWMLRRLGARRPVVIGHSMGGLVALQLAADRPRQVRAVVMVDSLISMQTRRDLRARQRRSEAAGQRPRAPLAELFHPDFDRRVALRVGLQAVRQPPHVAGPASASVFAHDSAAALRRLEVPGLFVAPDGGGRDPEKARRALRGTSVWFGQAVGSGHYVMIEVPDQFNAMLRRFLGAIGRRSRRAPR
ncbi:MAG: alpha/beta fold hydrolase [Proteobacteria bacterium]|nr:alpha/beta fold hydrolase [Pseudomonadota bacterium]